MELSVLTLNKLLIESGIDPSKTLVFRHRPSEPELNRVFDWIVSERPDLFACYQSTHSPSTEAALKNANYVASFIRYRPGLALFVGLFEIVGRKAISAEDCVSRPLHRELIKLGASGIHATDTRSDVIEFDMRLTNWQESWHQRLIVGWPPPERSWFRWADRNVFPVEAISEESRILQAMPSWDAIRLTWSDLQLMPGHWREALGHWRGIYLIVDQSDGRQYVGSAGGKENLLGRWLAYSKSGHGGNKLLRTRNPDCFAFSILQRVSPDMPTSEIVAIENSWKLRLNSRSPSGLNEN